VESNPWVKALPASDGAATHHVRARAGPEVLPRLPRKRKIPRVAAPARVPAYDLAVPVDDQTAGSRVTRRQTRGEGDRAMKLRTRWIAGFSAVALVLATSVAALGYTGQVLASISIAIEATGTCGETATVTATLLDANGAPVAGESVDWTLVTTQSASDTINETPTTTNANGVATTTVTLAAVAGDREVRATAGDVSASAVVSQSCEGLPNTSTLPAEIPQRGAPLAGMLLVALALALGGGLTLRRLAATSR